MKQFLKLILSIIILVIILKITNHKYSLDILINNISLYLIYLPFLIISLSIIALRWKKIFIMATGQKISYLQSLRLSSYSFGYNVVLFTGAGDLSKFYYVKNAKFEELSSIIIVERFSGLVMGLSINCIIIIFFFYNLLYASLVILLLVILLIHLVKNNIYSKHLPYININHYHFSKILNNKDFYFILILSGCLQAVFYLNYFFLINNFGVNISFYQTLLFISLLSIANSLPFFYSGFGAREVVGLLITGIILIDIKVLIDFTLTIGLLNLSLGLIVIMFIQLMSIKKKYLW